MIICLMSLVAGMLLALCTPVLQFAAGLFGVAVVADLVAWMGGTPAGTAAAWTIALYACAQVGYGCGIAAIAFLRERRLRLARDGRAPAPAPKAGTRVKAG